MRIKVRAPNRDVFEDKRVAVRRPEKRWPVVSCVQVRYRKSRGRCGSGYLGGMGDSELSGRLCEGGGRAMGS